MIIYSHNVFCTCTSHPPSQISHTTALIYHRALLSFIALFYFCTVKTVCGIARNRYCDVMSTQSHIRCSHISHILTSVRHGKNLWIPWARFTLRMSHTTVNKETEAVQMCNESWMKISATSTLLHLPFKTKRLLNQIIHTAT